MSGAIIKKRVSLTSMNLFGCEVDDSMAQISLFPEYFHIRAVGQEERVLFTEILSVKKKLWWYEILWTKNNNSGEFFRSQGFETYNERLAMKV